MRLVWALVLGLAGCAPPAAQPVAARPPVTASLPAPPPAPEPRPTERDAIAVFRAHAKPSMWLAIHSEIRDQPAGKVLVSEFASPQFEQAGIDASKEIDALLTGCAPEIGCFTLFEHHIPSDRIRRFMDLSAENSAVPAEWLSKDPPTVRVKYSPTSKGVAVLAQVNENLLLASLRPAPELVKQLEKTRGLEPSPDGYVAVGGMAWDKSGLVDGLSLRLKIEADGALAGDLRGTATDEWPAELTADFASQKLKRRFDVWWLGGIFSEDFKFEITGQDLRMPVRMEPAHVQAIVSGLRLAMRFR